MPGGRFAIDVNLIETLIPIFQPKGWFQAGDVTVLEDRVFDFTTSRIESDWTFIRAGVEERKHTTMRLYSAHELSDLLRRAGFTSVRFVDGAQRGAADGFFAAGAGRRDEVSLPVGRGLLRPPRLGAARRRDGEEEDAAFAELALDPDAAAVRLDDPLDDRQAQARAVLSGLARLPQAFEHVRQVIGGDAAAGVRHPEQDVFVRARRADGDARPPPR